MTNKEIKYRLFAGGPLRPEGVMDGVIIFLQYVSWSCFYFYFVPWFVRVREPRIEFLYGALVSLALSLIGEGVKNLVIKDSKRTVWLWRDKMFTAGLLAGFTLVGALGWAILEMEESRVFYGLTVTGWAVITFVMTYRMLIMGSLVSEEEQDRGKNSK